MARQRLGAKKVAQLARRLGLPIIGVFVRGGTDHRQDLCLPGGRILCYWPRTGETEETTTRHGLEGDAQL